MSSRGLHGVFIGVNGGDGWGQRWFRLGFGNGIQQVWVVTAALATLACRTALATLAPTDVYGVIVGCHCLGRKVCRLPRRAPWCACGRAASGGVSCSASLLLASLRFARRRSACAPRTSRRRFAPLVAPSLRWRPWRALPALLPPRGDGLVGAIAPSRPPLLGRAPLRARFLATVSRQVRHFCLPSGLYVCARGCSRRGSVC